MKFARQARAVRGLAAIALISAVSPGPALCAMGTCGPEPQDARTGRRFTPEQLTSDMNRLAAALEKDHGGLYRYTSKEDLARSFQEAVDQLDHEMGLFEFFEILTRYLSSIHCGHTLARLPQNWIDEVESPEFFPLVVRFVERRLFVLEDRSPSPAVAAGAEILSIDGRSVPRLIERILPHLPGDGFIETGRIRALEDRFSYFLKLFVSRSAARFQVELREPGAAAPRTVTLPSVPLAQLQGTEARSRRAPGLLLEVDAERSVARIAISSFSSRLESDTGLKFVEFLQHSFQRLCDEEIDHLILDLRDNGGGEDELGALLVSYLSEEEFGYFDRIEVTEQYEGRAGVVRDDDGRRLVTVHSGTDVQYPSDPVFLGDLYLLINGRSFSTCADVATVVHHRGLATFIGEETGGGYDGNTSGDSRRHVLSNTGITVNVPCWMYTTANVGHGFPGRGVIPDHEVEMKIEDLLEGRDTQLEYARKLILGESP